MFGHPCLPCFRDWHAGLVRQYQSMMALDVKCICRIFTVMTLMGAFSLSFGTGQQGLLAM